jgi:hypothetical protein
LGKSKGVNINDHCWVAPLQETVKNPETPSWVQSSRGWVRIGRKTKPKSPLGHMSVPVRVASPVLLSKWPKRLTLNSTPGACAPALETPGQGQGRSHDRRGQDQLQLHGRPSGRESRAVRGLALPIGGFKGEKVLLRYRLVRQPGGFEGALARRRGGKRSGLLDLSTYAWVRNQTETCPPRLQS